MVFRCRGSLLILRKSYSAGLRVTRGTLDRVERRETPGSRVPKANLVLSVHKEYLARLEKKETRDHRGTPVQQDLKDRPDQQVKQALRVRRVNLVKKAKREIQESRDHREFRALLLRIRISQRNSWKDCRDRRAHRAHLVQPEPTEQASLASSTTAMELPP
ncbi:hypothetical protein [Faecalibaculum rodentium]|uniref:hypothetical protein n=1 Tax=Faecalibaculum rodentium TaxID=1702221 RepID=UPI0025B77487|nr:hypothetical protein [Faecalibaculum rodentium]